MLLAFESLYEYDAFFLFVTDIYRYGKDVYDHK